MQMTMGTMMLASLLTALVSFWTFISDINGDYPFRNTSLPWDDRVNDLVSRLTLEEIVPQMAKTMPAPSIDRLGIKPFDWGTECLRGDVQAGPATSFPQALGLAASFSPYLIYEIAEATSIEVRAKYNNYTKAGIYGYHKGISCFSPVINIMRHPLWGRNQETYGEDPFMNGLYSQHFVKGLQGNDSRYVRASAGCKHFDVHGGPDNIPVSRFSFNSQVLIRDWRMTFLPAFRMCVEAGTYSLMCSYNRLNGVPACANKELLTDILRGEWGFTGYVVSDEGAVENIVNAHHYLNNSVDTVAACVNAGCSLDLSGRQDTDFYMNMGQAVNMGKLSMKTIVERLKPMFYTRMRLGEFDPSDMNPYTKLNLSVIESAAHIALAKAAAVQSIVLLKNRDQLLPLTAPSAFRQVAVVGPMADNPSQLFGDYNPESDPRYTITPYMALKTLGETITFASGCSDTKCTSYKSQDIRKAVTGSDIVFVILGTGQYVEAEGNDRADMNLPGEQLQLLQDAVQYANDAPIVLVLYNAGPLDIVWADESLAVKAIIEGFFPAQEAGSALLEVILGHQSPAGRLPFTWYRSADQTPGITDYTMSERTYRYFTGEPLYPFGYGLSYSNFTYLDITLEPTIEAGQDQTASIALLNSGKVTSDEVVQMYIKWMNASTPVPQLQLVGFQRVSAVPSMSLHVTLQYVISARQMAQWDDSTNQFFVEAGEIAVFAGGQQPNQTKSVGSNILQTSFQIKGQKYLGRF